MCVPSRNIIIRRADARSYLFKKCPWYPCHSELETCNMCFCVFYPCEEKNLGEYVTSSNGTKVWSCMGCSWIHMEETADALREFLNDAKNRKMPPKEMYDVFVSFSMV